MNRGELFNKLESLRNITHGVQTSLFDASVGKPNAEYWNATDLQNLCGVINMPWQDSKDMYEAMYTLFARTAQTMPYDTENVFNKHIIVEYSPKGAKVYDMQLSRYAAWILTAENPNMPFMRAYFMMPNNTPQTLAVVANNIIRAHSYAKLARNNRHIAGILNHDKIPFARFYADIHNTFFGNVSIDDIKARNGIKIAARDSIHNYMDAASMNALANGIESIICKYDECGRRNSDALSYIAVTEIRKARAKMIETNNRTPAQDIQKTNIKDVQSALQKIETAFIREYKSKTLR